MTKELLEKYLNNRCTSQEVDEVIQWMKQQSFFNESRELGKIDWQQFKDDNSIVSDEKLDTLLDRIHHKLNIEEPRTIQLKHRLISLLSKAAAIIVIPILAFLIYTVSENKKLTNQLAAVSLDTLDIIAPVGSRTLVKLTDGTVVHLNHGSRIKYPQNLSGKSRNIYLAGEAYFEVAHNPDKPFVVSTGLIDVKALGTIFNVNAYPRNNEIVTTLVEGKVLVEKIQNNGKAETIKELVPGQHLIYAKNTGIVQTSIEPVEKYIAWKDGKLVFENEPIDKVAQRLSQVFNVDIQVDDKLDKYKYTVTFADESLYQILDLMAVATPINYRTLPRTKNPDGTFSNQKIIIERKR